MARERVHTDGAARQAAYRQRKAAARAVAGPRATDADLAQAARDLHAVLEYAASTGDAAAAVLVLGETPLETLRNIGNYIAPPLPLMPL